MQIEAKLTRQRILTQDNPPRFTAVLDEAALHRVVGGRHVMAAQLAKILDMSALPNVRVQVLRTTLARILRWRATSPSSSCQIRLLA